MIAGTAQRIKVGRGVNYILSLGGGLQKFCPEKLYIALRKMKSLI